MLNSVLVCVSDFLGQTNPTRQMMDMHLRRHVVLSETLAQTSATALRQASRRHDVVAVQITDPPELKLPNVGWVVLQDSETGQIVEINTGDQRRREAYEKRQFDAQEELLKLFRVSGIDSIQLRTNEPYAIALEYFFEMRSKRRHLAA